MKLMNLLAGKSGLLTKTLVAGAIGASLMATSAIAADKNSVGDSHQC